MSQPNINLTYHRLRFDIVINHTPHQHERVRAYTNCSAVKIWQINFVSTNKPRCASCPSVLLNPAKDTLCPSDLLLSFEGLFLGFCSKYSPEKVSQVLIRPK